jgi:uncharacterized damage-inducible protein DinB
METRMSDEIKSFLHLIDEGFDKPGWHGPNLLGSLRRPVLEELLYRPRAGAHNAWELALHCAYWKHAIRKRLLGETHGRFALEGTNFFSRDQGATLADFKKDLAILKKAHRDLRATVEQLDPKTYGKPAKGSRHSVRRSVLGIAAHDIYHAGQIRLLRKLAAPAH